MRRDHVIAVGGTGARCAEAIIHLAAAGLFERPLHILMLDSDKNNGNVNRTRKLIELHQQLYDLRQPKSTAPRMLRQPINHQDEGPTFPCFFNVSGLSDITFGELVEFDNQNRLYKDFLRLFYTHEDLNMSIQRGYYGRASVGSVGLQIELDHAARTGKEGLTELLNNLGEDLRNGEVRVFIVGSIFGGTGEAAIPTKIRFLKNLNDKVLGGDKKNLRYGCAMMEPYFSFPKGFQTRSHEPVPDSDNHMVAAKAALLHYAHDDPGYHHVYKIGAPERRVTNPNNVPSGEGQLNDPHYAELVAALAALDFFHLDAIAHDAPSMVHYADGEAIQWDTLPFRSSQQRQALKHRMVTYATFAYFYKNFLYRALSQRKDYVAAPWYRHNFLRNTRGLSIADGDALNALYESAFSFLEWLHLMGKSCEQGTLFRWEGLLHDEIPTCIEYLGHLTDLSVGLPAYIHKDAYDMILKELDKLHAQVGNATPTGLLIYLLYAAITSFCRKNYGWK